MKSSVLDMLTVRLWQNIKVEMFIKKSKIRTI